MEQKPAWKVTFPIDQADTIDIMSALEDVLDNEPTSVSAFEDTETGQWHADALYAMEPDRADIERRTGQWNKGTLIIEPLADEDWVAKSLENLNPVTAGRFLVYAAHNEISPLPDQVPVLVGAGQAFGTGHHPTTTGCLMALDEIARSRDIKNALDLGCGTALLAVALAKVSKAGILATDIDPIAIEVANQVISDNGVAVDTAVATGFDHPQIGARKPYDFVFANILARPLIELAQDMADHVSKGGIVILSGLLATQEDEVRGAYEQAGFTCARRIPLEEWMTLVLERG